MEVEERKLVRKAPGSTIRMWMLKGASSWDRDSERPVSFSLIQGNQVHGKRQCLMPSRKSNIERGLRNSTF